jgi:hypothetical protein
MAFKLAFYKYRDSHILFPPGTTNFSIYMYLPKESRHDSIPYKIIDINASEIPKIRRRQCYFIYDGVNIVSPIFSGQTTAKRWLKERQNDLPIDASIKTVFSTLTPFIFELSLWLIGKW